MTAKNIRSEDAPEYNAKQYNDAARIRDEDDIIARAILILESRMRPRGETLCNPDAVRSYLRLRLTTHMAEVFAVLFMDNRHRLIEYREMFFGTIDGASVHPREVVRAALELNAAAVTFAHNHPSGVAEPSQSDLRITERLKDSLALIDVRVLDHMIVGETSVTSMAERGLI